MLVDTNAMVSISEANQNFSKVARLVDEHGSAVILKNNTPKYVIYEYEKLENDQIASLDEVSALSKRFIKKNKEA